MKKEIKDKLIELASFCICIVVLLAIAYYSGFIKGFTGTDFKDSYNELIYNLSNNVSKNKLDTGLFNTNNSYKRQISTYKGYQPMRIPDDVLRGVYSSRAWENVFNSNKKVVFYVYNNSQIEFNNSITNYLSSETKGKYYNLITYTESNFESMRLGDIGPSKICDSFEECNAVRKKAIDYSALSEFMKQCGRYMCIINPQQKQYVKLQNKNSSQAVKMIFDLINW